MNLKLIIDNDVLIKCACFVLLDELRPLNGEQGAVAVLGAARYVVLNYLKRRGVVNNRAAAEQCFASYLERVSILEPTEEELALASLIEEAAIMQGLDLDGGESQLCAIAIIRLSPFLLTGDKRAIRGAEKLQGEVSELTALRGRVICLEQAIVEIASRVGIDHVRSLVCAESAIDKSLSICLQCKNEGLIVELSNDGLLSYVRSLRAEAPTLLYDVDIT